MNLMVLPNRLCLIVKLYINRPELLPDTYVQKLLIQHNLLYFVDKNNERKKYQKSHNRTIDWGG